MNSSNENLKTIARSPESNSDAAISQENVDFEEPLSEREVHLSMYKGVCTGENKKTTKDNDEWSLQMNLTQEWFIRCSWINKFLFLETLCKSTRGCLVIESILKCIESIIAKDVMESMANDCPEFSYDRIPRDDNRSLPSGDLDKIIHKDFIWFVGLTPTRQITVLVKLLKLGGGGLVFNIYKSLVAVHADRKYVNGQMSLSKDTGLKITGSQQKMKKNPRLTISKQNIVPSTTGSAKTSSSNEYTNKKNHQLARRESAILEYKISKGIFHEDAKTSKKDDTKETIDYLQILPIHLNRKIMSYVDEKTLTGFKKVGRYWAKMIDDSINEKSGRRAINAKINKIIGTKLDRRKEKRQNKSKTDESDEEDGEIAKDDELENFAELGKKEFFNRNNLCEKDLINSMKIYENILSKKFQVLKLDNSAFSERTCCWDMKIEMMACSTTSNVIYFYSMRTGSRLNLSVFGFESSITCLALHVSGIQVIVGLSDGSMLSKFIRTNEIGTKFPVQRSAIKFLSVTSSNLLASSKDNFIKYFQLWSGVCLICIDLSSEYTVSCHLLMSCSQSEFSVIGTSQGVLVLVDNTKTHLRKLILHNGEITALCNFDNLLVTADENGNIRLWEATHLETYLDILNPYYDIKVTNTVTSLFMHQNQIFAGCENGTIQVLSLGHGKVYKILGASGQASVLAAIVVEDRLSFKIIIWHDEGIEMRIFSLLKGLSNGKSTMAEEKLKNPCECNRRKFYSMLLSSAENNKIEKT